MAGGRHLYETEAPNPPSPGPLSSTMEEKTNAGWKRRADGAHLRRANIRWVVLNVGREENGGAPLLALFEKWVFRGDDSQAFVKL